MSENHNAKPVTTVNFFSPGVKWMMGIIAAGAFFGIWRLLFGLKPVTNLTDQYPWGLSITIDVATGVALAAGGFTTSALVHIFHRDKYLALVRPALLTAMLGYTFVGIGLMFDLGKYYNIWHPIFMWQGNSVLFEVGICVVCYITVLYIEFLPIAVERFKNGVKLPGPLSLFNKPADWFLSISDSVLKKVLFLFIILGVLLSCMHQSSLGTLMLIAPSKMSALWYTPVMPLLFLLSAIAVGFPMVIFESLIASRSMKLQPEMDLLSPLAKLIPIFLGIYLAAKVIDMAVRESYTHFLDSPVQTALFLIEMTVGVLLPFLMLLSDKVRNHAKWLFLAVSLIVGGVALNRLNVFLVAYTPPFAQKSYFPSIGEFAVTAALIATLALVYRFVALNFPVIEGHPKRQGKSA